MVLDTDVLAELDADVERLRASDDRRALVSALTNAGRPVEAWETLRELTAESPNAYYLWRLRRDRATSIGETEDAISCQQHLIRTVRRNLKTQQQLLVMFASLGREEEAQQFLSDIPDSYRRILLARAWAAEMRRLRKLDNAEATVWVAGQLDDASSLSDADHAAFGDWLRSQQLWNVAGPLDAGEGFTGFDQSASIENHANADALPEPPNEDLTWSPVTAPSGGFIDLSTSIGQHEQVVGYAIAFVEVDQARLATIMFGSDDAGKVWLNGELVHTARVNRQFLTAADRFPVSLKAGRNTLLLKIGQGSGEWGFSVDFIDDRGVPISVRWRD